MTTQQLEQHRTKAFLPVRFKAEGEDAGDGTKLGPGEFIALAAVFDNIDSYGDRIIKGAFAETLEQWASSGDPIPVIWQHNWADPNAHIGYVLEATETDEGLLYRGKLDIEDNAFALQVYRLMKGRRVTQQSFGFDVIDGRSVTEEGRDVFEITRVHLYEVGPCLVGVNQATNLLEIKSAPAGSTSSAPASAAAATSGQAASSASESTSVSPGSVPDPSPASKGISPASAKLLLEELEMEGAD
jgi:HK97 family phage prohead protease